MPRVTERPTAPTLPRPRLESLASRKDIVTIAEYHLTFQRFGELLQIFRQDETMTADEFWIKAQQTYHKLTQAIGYQTTSIEEFATHFLHLHFSTPEFARREIDHEKHHGRVAAEFAQNHNLPTVIEYGTYNLLVHEYAMAHAPFMSIKNIEAVLTTRELILDYYDTMLEDNPDPSPGDQQVATGKRHTFGPRVTAKPTAPTLPWPRVDNH